MRVGHVVRHQIVRNLGEATMVYQLKDQDVTPPPPDPANRRSATRDGVAAVVMVLLTAGLIALIVGVQIL